MSMKKDGIQTRKRKAKMASKAATPTREMNNTPDHNIMPSSYATSMPYTGNQSSGLLDLSVTRSDNQLGNYCHQYKTKLYSRECIMRYMYKDYFHLLFCCLFKYV